jgi:hypothetical protein
MVTVREDVEACCKEGMVAPLRVLLEMVVERARINLNSPIE